MPERPTIQLARVNLIVHPMFDRPRLDMDYGQAVGTAYANSLKRFTPTSPDHLLLIMPMLRRRGKGSFNESHENAIRNQNYGSWIEVYRDHKSNTIYPSNVRLVPDIIARNTVADLECRIARMGKEIGPETLVVLGGEYTDYCVTSTAFALLESSASIRKLRIDKTASVTYIGRVGGMQHYDDTTTFTHRQDARYIYWERK
jgi:hypothetical protein